MYSNPIFAANQAYLTVMNQENNKLVHVGIYNKQGHRGKMISAKSGHDIQCGTTARIKNHDGECLANFRSDAPIGSTFSGQLSLYTIKVPIQHQ